MRCAPSQAPSRAQRARNAPAVAARAGAEVQGPGAALVPNVTLRLLVEAAVDRNPEWRRRLGTDSAQPGRAASPARAGAVAAPAITGTGLILFLIALPMILTHWAGGLDAALGNF